MLSFEKKIVQLLFVSMILCGFGIILFQAYEWLRIGFAPHYSVANVMAMVGVEWARNPTDWFGVFKILKVTPFSLILVLFGLIGLSTTF